MSDLTTTDDGPPPKGEVRPLTEQLIQSAMFDTWPGNAAVMDFGIDSDRHLGALHHAIRHGEVTAEELDVAMGKGEKLTEIAQRGNNPYRDVTFRTAWDGIPLEPEEPPDQGQGVPGAEKPGSSVIDRGPIEAETDRVVNEMEKSWQASRERPGATMQAKIIEPDSYEKLLEEKAGGSPTTQKNQEKQR